MIDLRDGKYSCALWPRLRCEKRTDAVYCVDHQAVRDSAGSKDNAHPAAQEIDAAFRAAAARVRQG